MEEKEIDTQCPNCGSQLKYHTKRKNLKCVSCSSEFNIESFGKGKLDEEELDYNEMLEKLKNTKLEKSLVESLHCENCGAILNCDSTTTSTICPFCGSSHIIKKNLEEEVIPISGIIPFVINKRECQEQFHKWIKGKAFAPNHFKNSKFDLDLFPIYLPYWTFDMNCHTTYEAKRGDHYYVNVTKHDMHGNLVSERERRTRCSLK